MEKARSAPLRGIALVIAATLAMEVVLFLLVVKDVSGPLVGGRDVNQHEYAGYFLLEHLTFVPWPRLELVTDDVLYPFGTNASFQPWVIERDLVYAGCRHVLGLGPWNQLYFLATTAIGALGGFALLVRAYEPRRAAVASLAATFMNFYAIHKYPHHLNMAIVHWTTLAIMTDFLIVRAVVRREPLSVHMVLWRVALVFLTLGQELGYVSGMAVLSAFLSGFFVAGVLSRRASALALRGTMRRWWSEARSSPWSLTALGLLAAVGALLYLPITLQIVRATARLGPVDVGGVWWTNQLRILIPYLPYLHPESAVSTSIFGDEEGFGEDSCGWALLAAGLYGLHCIRKRGALRVYLPLIVFFVVCMAFHPTNFPTLYLFPWFKFFRVAGRRTIVLPVVMTLFALEASFSGWRRPRARRTAIAIALLALAEVATAYGVKAMRYHPYVAGDALLAFMATVRAAPGEAVLDWPFCIAGGNGVGTHDLCPFYARNLTVGTYQRFHEKKVVGQYLSRLHTDQIAPFLAAGWPRLFSPDSTDLERATHQTRCLDVAELDFIADFLARHDFAGVNLYPELLAEGCASAFYRRLGAPTAWGALPGVGAVAFIPRRAAWGTPAP